MRPVPAGRDKMEHYPHIEKKFPRDNIAQINCYII